MYTEIEAIFTIDAIFEAYDALMGVFYGTNA